MSVSLCIPVGILKFVLGLLKSIQTIPFLLKIFIP
jgi:hypothetical protein